VIEDLKHADSCADHGGYACTCGVLVEAERLELRMLRDDLRSMRVQSKLARAIRDRASDWAIEQTDEALGFGMGEKDRVIDGITDLLKTVSYLKEPSALEQQMASALARAEKEILRLRDLSIKRTHQTKQIVIERDEAIAALSIHDMRLL
jgi:hypothetical protein